MFKWNNKRKFRKILEGLGRFFRRRKFYGRDKGIRGETKGRAACDEKERVGRGGKEGREGGRREGEGKSCERPFRF